MKTDKAEKPVVCYPHKKFKTGIESWISVKKSS